jgi:hypothetical protein
MRSRRLLTRGPANEALWVRLHVHEIEDRWAAVIVADDATPPEPGSFKGLSFFADTAEEAERLALANLGEGVAQN